MVAYFLSKLTHVGDKELIDDAFLDEHLFSISIHTPWFVDIANYLATGKFPQHFTYKEKCNIIRKSDPFSWIRGYLFKKGLDHILRRCIREDQVHDVLHACNGHCAAKRTAYKVLQTCYYWPNLHKDARNYVSRFDDCQRMGQPTHRDEMFLPPQVIVEDFEK